MKKLIAFFVLFTPFRAVAQDFKLPEKDGLIIYEEVVSLDTSFTKDKIYYAVRNWVVKSFRSANSVIQNSDKELGNITAKGIFKVDAGRMLGVSQTINGNFTITIDIKEGKYRYRISDMSQELTKGETYSLEHYYDKYKRGSQRKICENVCRGFDRECKKLIENLKSEVEIFIIDDF